MFPELSRDRRGIPLTLRLTLALTVASLFVATLVAFLGADRTERARDRAEAAGQFRFTEQFAERIAPLLEHGDLLRLSMLATAARDLAKGRIVVVDGNGKVALDTALVLGQQQLGLLTLGGAFQRSVDQEGERLRETLVPVRFGGDPIGEVRIQCRPAPVASVFDIGWFGLMILCCLTLVATAALMIHQWASRVRQVTNALLQLATGNLTSQLCSGGAGELKLLDEALHELERGVQDGLQRVVEPFVAMALQLVESLERSGSIPAGHGERTALYADRLAEKLELLADDRRDLELACRLQDLGKAWVRPAILQHQDELADDERKSLQSHPQLAADHLASLPALRRVATVIRHQNERYDGCGGPSRLRGDRIPLGARIRVIAASFDLLTTCGEGRALGWQQGLAKMAQDRGEVFDPWLLDLFVADIHRDPPAQRVDRPVMLMPGDSVPQRLDMVAEVEDGLDYDLGQELEVMLDERPPEERA